MFAPACNSDGIISATIRYRQADVQQARRVPDNQGMRTRVREIRRTLGWTQNDLAERACVTQGAISGVENGRLNATADTLERIAKALGVELGDLFVPEGEAPAAGDLVARISRLSEENRRLAEEYVAFLASRKSQDN